jgi:Fe-S-cluster containining protein
VFSEAEWTAVSETFGVPEPTIINRVQHTSAYMKELNGQIAVMAYLPNGNCPYLKEGKCSIYYLRPKVCRDYGVVEDLPCMYLYPDKAEQKQRERLKRLGR